MRSCDHCGSSAVLDIVYGRPTEETFERARRNEVWLGGCMGGDGSPAYHCTQCKKHSGVATSPLALLRVEPSAEAAEELRRRREALAREKEERRRVLKARARQKSTTSSMTTRRSPSTTAAG